MKLIQSYNTISVLTHFVFKWEVFHVSVSCKCSMLGPQYGRQLHVKDDGHGIRSKAFRSLPILSRALISL